jgi:hypothetical protein
MKIRLLQLLCVWIGLILPTAAAAQNGLFATRAKPALAAPKVTVLIEPSDGTAILYSPLSPQVAGGKGQSLIVLAFKIINQEADTVKLRKVVISFPSPPKFTNVVYEPNFSVQPGKIKTLELDQTENIRISYPAPSQINFEITFEGFTPITISKPLVAYKNMVTGGSYRFPTKATDLAEGEYWSGASGHKGGGDTGKPGEDMPTT